MLKEVEIYMDTVLTMEMCFIKTYFSVYFIR